MRTLLISIGKKGKVSKMEKLTLDNFEIDKKLLEEALALSDSSTANLLIEELLREYVRRHKQLKILDLFGTIDYEEDYDYKQQRQVK